ncbi:MAG: glycoside hydrolase family 28 protein [Bacteroidia bacterium]|nr:glycoside hydrolase family 28 protein [Bacteroidia bacterium]
MKQFFTAMLILLVAQPALCSKDYDIVSFGALADGKTLNTKAIQSAIDRAHNDGGGRVVIPSGQFLTGTIELKTGVELHLSKKAILLGSTNPKDYRKKIRWDALILADSAENIRITGKGIIDGQGAELALHIDSLFYVGEVDSSNYILFPEKRPMARIRPQIIEFRRCSHVEITDVTIQNGAGWVQTYWLCYDLVIDRVRVESDAYWNNDGIDILDCVKVRITNCYVNASDDGICLKSYGHPNSTSFCDSVYIADCVVRSSASAVKLGTASYGGFKNIIIERIKVFDTFRSAIAIESYGKGFVENVLVQDVKATNTGNAIFIRIGKRLDQMAPGILKDVTIKNVHVKVPFKRPDYKYVLRGPALPFFHNTFPSSITGLPSQKVENVTLENITISYPGRGVKAYANLPLSRLDDVPEVEKKYPEFSMFGELPAWGFYVRHVDGLTFSNVKIKIRKPDYRPAFVFDDVQGLNLNSVEVKGDDKKEDYIYHNVK